MSYTETGFQIKKPIFKEMSSSWCITKTNIEKKTNTKTNIRINLQEFMLSLLLHLIFFLF